MGVEKTRWNLKKEADKAYRQGRLELARRAIKSLLDKIYPDLEEEETSSLQNFVEKKEKEHEANLRSVEKEKKKTNIVRNKTRIERKGERKADERYIEDILGKLDEILIGKSMVPE